MKKTLLALVPLTLAILTFWILWNTFDFPLPQYYSGDDKYPYSKGNAPPDVRESIGLQLDYFEKGYLERDTTLLESYCDRLISKENILILGTMPNEIYSGYEAAADLIGSDWLYWGDVYYQMDQANISITDSVAWISTIAHVEFDMSRFLVLPLRYTAIMVNEDSSWKFQQMQFQFDLGLMNVLIAIILLLLTSVGFFIRFVVILIKQL